MEYKVGDVVYCLTGCCNQRLTQNINDNSLEANCQSRICVISDITEFRSKPRYAIGCINRGHWNTASLTGDKLRPLTEMEKALFLK